MEILIASFVLFFISMLALVAVQYLRDDVLPTGCTPGGCLRCRKDCPSKKGRETSRENGEAGDVRA